MTKTLPLRTKILKKVVAVSPLIGDKSISGPAHKYMKAAGIESNVYSTIVIMVAVTSIITPICWKRLHTFSCCDGN